MLLGAHEGVAGSPIGDWPLLQHVPDAIAIGVLFIVIMVATLVLAGLTAAADDSIYHLSGAFKDQTGTDVRLDVERGHPVLMSMFYIGGELAQSRLGLPKSLTGVFQGLLLFTLLACDTLIAYRVTWTGLARRAA